MMICRNNVELREGLFENDTMDGRVVTEFGGIFYGKLTREKDRNGKTYFFPILQDFWSMKTATNTIIASRTVNYKEKEFTSILMEQNKSSNLSNFIVLIFMKACQTVKQSQNSCPSLQQS
jgi:hypothetical protein